MIYFNGFRHKPPKIQKELRTIVLSTFHHICDRCDTNFGVTLWYIRKSIAFLNHV